MSYFVVDANGDFTGDIATCQGIQELDAGAGKALSQFLESGQADETLALEIIDEVASTNLDYLQPLFQGEAPFTLTNGIQDQPQ